MLAGYVFRKHVAGGARERVSAVCAQDLHATIRLVLQFGVGATSVPGIARVEANHVQACMGEFMHFYSDVGECVVGCRALGCHM